MRNPETVLVRVILTLLERAEDLGLDRGALARLTGLEGVESQEPDARVPVSPDIRGGRFLSLA